MKFGILPFLLASFACGLFSYQSPAFGAGPTREELLSAQTDGLGMRRGKKREDDGLRDPMRMNREREPDTRSSATSGSSRVSSPAGPGPDSGSSVTTSSGRVSGTGIVTGLGAPAAGGMGKVGPVRHSGVVTGAGTAAPVVSGGARAGAGIVNGAGTRGGGNAMGHGRGGKH